MKLSVSPSGSLKLLDKSTVCAPPATVRFTRESEPVGALLVTVTPKAVFAHLPPGSVAVMVIFVFPFPFGVMPILSVTKNVKSPTLTVEKRNPTVATDVSLDSTE